ncbi:MAG: NAD(P)-dependent oxidoreductase [Arenicellales bacterium]|jgi:3-hydroxyisobutyrate dehydrogenase-like beta-hydroxyacid dehydrogenase|nr:NAD(P)-dependent oxidoreductase [Arenicellales bacterium]
MNCGFIGLGMLGEKMAKKILQAGHSLQVYDQDTKAVERLVAAGATGAGSVQDTTSHIDTLITCLPSPAICAQVMTGAGGALETLSAGSCWIEMSTTDADEMKRLASLACERGIDVLECPATGGVHRAVTGQMTLLVGGDEVVFERLRPLLEIMSGQMVYMGEIGNASLIKVVTNLLCLIDLVAMGEGLMLAKRGGLDLARCYEAITASSGSSREFEDWAPVILNGSFNTGFTTDLGLKDLGFVTELGRRLDVPLKLATLVEQMFQASRERYGGDAWTPHVVKMMEEATGEELRAEGFPDVIPQN